MKLKFLANILLILVVGTLNAQTIKGTFAIKNVETGKLLRIKDAKRNEGTPLVLYSPVNWKCMTWDFKPISGDIYQLSNLFTNKTFSPEKEMKGSGLEQMVIDEGNEQQHWEFLKQVDGTYLIRLSGTDLYLTPSDPDGKVNSPVILVGRQKNGLQCWTIYEQHPSF